MNTDKMDMIGRHGIEAGAMGGELDLLSPPKLCDRRPKSGSATQLMSLLTTHTSHWIEKFLKWIKYSSMNFIQFDKKNEIFTQQSIFASIIKFKIYCEQKQPCTTSPLQEQACM